MIPEGKVKDLISRHKILEKELSSGEIDKNKFAEKSKEYSELNDIILISKQYIEYEANKNELDKIINDKKTELEMREMAETELKELNEKHIIN